MSVPKFSLKKSSSGSGTLAGLAAGLFRAPPPAHNSGTLASSAPSTATNTNITTTTTTSTSTAGSDDPFDAFMAEIDGTVKQQQGTGARTAPAAGVEPSRESGGVEETEAGEGFVRSLDARAALANYGEDDSDVYAAGARYAAEDDGEDELEYGADGAVIGVARKGKAAAAGARDDTADLEPLPRVDHASQRYEAFRRQFLVPPSDEIAAREAGVDSIADLREELSLRVEGDAPLPPPVQSFMHLGLDSHPALLTTLANAGYESPTAIQAQALPVLLSGRDLIGQAATGSGKTLAYLLPLVRHCIEQRDIEVGEGPIGLILVPTRELATQVQQETRKFARALGMTSVLLVGGSSKWEQTKALKTGAEIVVATPGRLIDHVRDKSTNLSRVTFLVFDEADRMFELGFQKHVYSISNAVRPDRQTVMFSATFPPRVDSLAATAMSQRPIRVTVGHNQANSSVAQTFFIMPHESKWAWLASTLPPALARRTEQVEVGSPPPKVLIFVSGRAVADELCASINRTPAIVQAAAASSATPAQSAHVYAATASPATVVAMALHGDKHQSDRDDAISRFKKGTLRVLVATDVAARGLDVKDVGTVINFDAARSIETHIHRVGRTGRIGADGAFVPGTALTLITPKEAKFAGQVVNSLASAKQPIPDELIALARSSSKWRPQAASTVPGGGSGGSSSSSGGGGNVRADGSWAGPRTSTSAAAGGGPRRGTAAASSSSSGGGGGRRKGPLPSSSGAIGLGFGSADDDGEEAASTSTSAAPSTGSMFLRAKTSASNFAQGADSRGLYEDNDEDDGADGNNATNAAPSSSSAYRPPVPEPLNDAAARVAASIAAVNAAAHAAERVESNAERDVQRAIAVIKRTAAAALSASSSSGERVLLGPDDVVAAAAAAAADERRNDDALAREDGDDIGDVDLDGDDNDECSNLRRRSGGSRGYHTYRTLSAHEPASTTAAAGAAGGGMAAFVQQRSAVRFASSFVSAGQLPSISASSNGSTSGNSGSSAGISSAPATISVDYDGRNATASSFPPVAALQTSSSSVDSLSVGAAAASSSGESDPAAARKKRSRWDTGVTSDHVPLSRNAPVAAGSSSAVAAAQGGAGASAGGWSSSSSRPQLQSQARGHYMPGVRY